MTETLEDKAARYLVEERVTVLEANGRSANLTVLGSGDTPYEVVYNGDWRCNCPARVTTCAHVLACQKIIKFRTQRKLQASDESSELSKLLSEALRG